MVVAPEVGIAEAGISGLAAAEAFRDWEYAVTVLERRSELGNVGASIRLRIPTKPATYSDQSPARYSDFIPASIPI